MTGHHHSESPAPPRPPFNFWANLRQPMPRRQKWRLFYRNLWIRVEKRQDCCGHFGQPGC